MNQEPPASEKFRDSIATADRQGRRIWVYPVKPKGSLYRWRSIVSLFLIGFFFSAPFIHIAGRPILQLDILKRQFHIFGFTFWPQDFHLFVLTAIAFVVFVILFTAVFGRLFCGWICPQTIFMEMVFRRIEQWLEGDGPRQRDFDRRAMNIGKFLRKAVKHILFFGISFLVGNTFLAYIVGVRELWSIVTDPPSQHIAGLTAMIIFSSVFYWVFAWFREQVCTLVCPYGRLQSVLLDSNSIVVGYDYRRGEPRGPLSRGGSFDNRGHCIDCVACVKVCPTGIDIRNGTQLECINCTACIDACNRVMKRMKLPKGLIRYTSESAIAEGRKFRFTGRIVIYSIVLTVLIGVLGFLTIGRSPVETTVLRTPGQLYQELEDGTIRNLYSIRVVNKTNQELPIAVELKSHDGEITMIGSALTVPPAGLVETAMFIDIARSLLHGQSTTIELEVRSGDDLLETVITNFNGPRSRTGVTQ